MTLITKFGYDRNGNLTSSTDARNVTTTFEYDVLNRLRFTRVPGINENGSAVTISTENTYNSMGNVLTHKDERGNATANTYSPMGFLTHVTDPSGGTSYFEYDLAGRLTAQVSSRHYVQGAALSGMPRQTFVYDNMDRVTEKREIYRTYGTNTMKTVISERLSYDKNGNIIKMTDANDNATNMLYDLANRLVSSTDPLLNKTLYSYDGLGRLKRQTNARGIHTDFVCLLSRPNPS